jgi:tRNA/rRNA methyltransferase
MQRLLERCRVVLWRPALPANLGAVARVMRNFGLRDLRLIAPHADPLDEQARKLSTHGEPLLHAARSATDLADAVGDCGFVLGSSARTRGIVRRQSLVCLADIMPRVVDALQTGPVAIVFGPEQTGLDNDAVSRCHYLATIPACDDYPVLNLGQAVAICLYELHEACRCQSAHPAGAGQSPVPPLVPAPFAQQERAFEHLERALRDIHFLWGADADRLMHALRHLLGRAQPTQQEVDLLFGLARQIDWFVRHRTEETPMG